MMQFIFRADASIQIGSGHIMRCLCLAEELKKHNAQIYFIVRYLPEYLRKIILEKGFHVFYLPESPFETDDLFHSTWLGVSQKDDAISTLNIIQKLKVKPDWLIVDSYALDERWEKTVKPAVDKVLVIDDLADRVHDCDVLLDQNQYLNLEGRYVDKVKSTTKLLLGAHFSILRDEFIEQKKYVHVRGNEVKRVFLFFGGMDQFNYTGKILKALQTVLSKNIKVDVVIGQLHPDKQNIMHICLVNGYQCYVQVSNISELMAQADIAIGAGGSACWERCCVGLPSLAFAIAENQIQLTKDAGYQKIIYSPEIDLNNSNAVAIEINNFIKNSLLRKQISINCLNLVDGLGKQYIVSQLLG